VVWPTTCSAVIQIQQDEVTLATSIRKAVLLVGAFIAASGCGILDPSGRPLLMTDRDRYIAHPVAGSGQSTLYSFTLIARFTNTTRQPLYLGRCSPNSPHPKWFVVLADLKDDSGYGPAWACGGHDQHLRLGPGASRTDTLEILGPTTFDHFSGVPLGAIEGQMRLGYELRTGTGDVACIQPPPQGLSHTFSVTVARQ